MKLAEAVSLRLTELMKQKNTNGHRLSEGCGVSQATISDIKLQRNTGVNLRIIFELSEGLGISLADFFDSPLFRDHNIED